ncbi:elastase [Octopus sinensis]|uniref:Elastase n=1 Tax=Octopus sinensis TaxID=2607531 RepID=A0A6P7TXY7_9MOLL|nr:elastase [Octopus sinensis]
MATCRVGVLLLFLVILAFLGSHCVTSAKWRQARDVFLSNVETLSEMVKRQPSHMITTRDLFGLTKDEDVELTDSAPSVQGTDIKKYHETYRGLPVFDATLTVETDAKTHVYTGQVTGKLVQNLDDDINSTIPNVTEQEAVQLALMYGKFPMEGARIDSDKPQLMIYVKDSIGILVYRVQYFAVSDGENYRFCMMINAKTGRLVDKWNTLETAREKYQMKGIGGNKLIGKKTYGELLPYLQVRRTGEDCYFRNSFVIVVNLNGKEFLSDEDEKTYHTNCKNGAKDEINGAYSPVNDALFYGTIIHNMYMEWVKVPPKKQLPMIFRVHYGHNTAVANYNGRNFTFGDGDDTFLPLVGLDIVAHEVTHCFTEEHSNLVYKGQSGGIDESFSDLAGEAAEYFEKGSNDWEAGGGVTKNSIRKLCKQSEDGKSITDAGNISDDMDVHYLSGVFNRFYCLLANYKDWSVKKVFQITAHSNRFYWHPKTNFTEAACDIMKSTYDLGYDTASVQESFAKVGIKVCDISMYIRNIHENSVVEGLSSVPGEKILFKLNVKTVSLKKVKVITFAGTGEVDVYACYKRSRCSERLTKWRSSQPGTDQFLSIRHPKVGKYFVTLKPKTRSYFANVTIKVNYEKD